jgi:hypothetical protein
LIDFRNIRLVSKEFKKSYENHEMWKTYFNKEMQWARRSSLYGEENHFFTLILNAIIRDNESAKMMEKIIEFFPSLPKWCNPSRCFDTFLLFVILFIYYFY